MLPTFPKAQKILDEEWNKRMFAAKAKIFPTHTASYSLESLVALVARRLWRNALAAIWSPITQIDMVRIVPDEPRDMLLWNWGHERGANQSRKFDTPQSWAKLLVDSRRNESESLPNIIRDDFEFAMLFLLCFPHRLSRALVKDLEGRMRFL